MLKKRDRLADAAIKKSSDFLIMFRVILQGWLESQKELAPDMLGRFKWPPQLVRAYADYLAGAMVVTELYGRLHAYQQVQQFQDFSYHNIGLQTAFDFFSAKIPLLREDYDYLVGNYRDKAFTIANVDSLAALETTQARLMSAIGKGTTLFDFVKDIEGLGLGLTDFHQETVFRTNLMSAYSAGQWESIQEAEEEFIQYDGIFDDRQRDGSDGDEDHRGLIYGQRRKPPGRIVPVNQVNVLPPFGYNCRCGFFAVPADEVDYNLVEPFTSDDMEKIDFKGIPQTPQNWKNRRDILDNIQVDPALEDWERDAAISRARLEMMNDPRTDAELSGFKGIYVHPGGFELLGQGAAVLKPKKQKITKVPKPEPLTDEFVPAKTKKEAEAYAVSQGFTKAANYRGLPLEYANRLNKILTELHNKYGIKLDILESYSKKRGGVEASHQASTRIIDGKAVEIKLKLRVNTAGIKKHGAEYDNYIKNIHNFDNYWVPENFEDIITHEIGHHLTEKGLDFKSAEKIDRILRAKGIKGISRYAETMLHETLAEAFVLYNRGAAIPAEALKLINKYIFREG